MGGGYRFALPSAKCQVESYKTSPGAAVESKRQPSGETRDGAVAVQEVTRVWTDVQWRGTGQR